PCQAGDRGSRTGSRHVHALWCSAGGWIAPLSIDLLLTSQIVGMFPPSMTYSLPVLEDARSETRNATNSATSSGRLGRPSGIPPSDSINFFLAAVGLVPACVANRSMRPSAALVSVNPGATLFTRMPCGPTSLESPLL